jgi:DNA-binding transcriptional regulator YbjK
VDVPTAGETEAARATTFRRSRGSSRGEARRRDLLTRVTDDVQVNGLADFSLRRAARAAGTTHKVLLYYFADADDLLAHAVAELRARRIRGGLAAALDDGQGSLVERVRALWPVLTGAEDAALEQAMGLAMYDPSRYARLAADGSAEYLRALHELCPPGWSEQRKQEVANLVLAAMRGLLLARRTSGNEQDSAAGLAALERALAREIAAPE